MSGYGGEPAPAETAEQRRTLVAAVVLGVSATVLRMLRKLRSEEVHVRATWIFTPADVVANAAVTLSEMAVLLTGCRCRHRHRHGL